MIEVSGRSPFLSSFPHPETLHLRYLNMGTRTAPATGRHIVVSKNTYYTANTVSRIFYDVNVLVNETHCMDFGQMNIKNDGNRITSSLMPNPSNRPRKVTAKLKRRFAKWGETSGKTEFGNLGKLWK